MVMISTVTLWKETGLGVQVSLSLPGTALTVGRSKVPSYPISRPLELKEATKILWGQLDPVISWGTVLKFFNIQCKTVGLEDPPPVFL